MKYFVKELADELYPRQRSSTVWKTYTVMSKRKLLQLVKRGLVAGAGPDPRMPTICGLRRRGYTPESIKNFIQKIEL